MRLPRSGAAAVSAPTFFFNVAVSRFHTDKKTNEEPRVLCLSWWRDSDPEPDCRLIAQPGRITIDKSTIPYHGLSIDRLLDDGEDPQAVISDMEKAAAGASAMVSFNGEFHWRQLYRLMGVDASPPSIAVCAMKLA